MSTLATYAAHHPRPAVGTLGALRRLSDLFARLAQASVLRQLTEHQRLDAGLPVELDGLYTEVFRNIGWN